MLAPRRVTSDKSTKVRAKSSRCRKVGYFSNARKRMRLVEARQYPLRFAFGSYIVLHSLGEAHSFLVPLETPTAFITSVQKRR